MGWGVDVAGEEGEENGKAQKGKGRAWIRSSAVFQYEGAAIWGTKGTFGWVERKEAVPLGVPALCSCSSATQPGRCES